MTGRRLRHALTTAAHPCAVADAAPARTGQRLRWLPVQRALDEVTP